AERQRAGRAEGDGDIDHTARHQPGGREPHRRVRELARLVGELDAIGAALAEALSVPRPWIASRNSALKARNETLRARLAPVSRARKATGATKPKIAATSSTAATGTSHQAMIAKIRI